MATKQNNKKQEERPAIRFKYLAEIKVSKVTLELTQEQTHVKRVKLETTIGNVTYKPKKRLLEIKELAGFIVESMKTDLFELSEFIASNPMLVALSKECKKSAQDVTLSYAEIDRYDDIDEEVKTYKFMNKTQFDTVYCKAFHKDDLSNITKQKENMEKYAVKEIEL